MKKVGKTIRPLWYTVQVTSRFKGLDLIDRMPEKLWTEVNEVNDIVQELVIKNIPKKKKCKKAKWLSEAALQIAAKTRGERQRTKGKTYPSDAEFQRLTRRDKKVFLREWWREIEENNGMGKTRDFFNKIRDTK